MKTKTRPNFLLIISTLLASLLFLPTCNPYLMRKINIIYYTDATYSTPEQMTSLNFEVPDGTILKGEPKTWGDGRWKYSSTGDYGYRDQNGKRHFFDQDNGVYSFKYASSDKEFLTSTPVTSDLNLLPQYSSASSDAVVNLIYYKSSVSYSNTGVPIYTVRECSYPQSIKPSDDGTYKYNVQSAISYIRSDQAPEEDRQTLDPEVGYGYVDWNDNGRRYVLYPDNLTLTDEDGNLYTDNVSLPSAKNLYFTYIQGGFEPKQDYLGLDTSYEPIYLDMVFIPGTEGTRYPWPNPHAEWPGDYAEKYSHSSSVNVSDKKDYSHPIDDIAVLDTFVARKLIYSLTQHPYNEEIFNVRYKFYADSTPPTDAFAPEKGMYNPTKNNAWVYINLYDQYLMCNMLTYIYNQANASRQGFEPLSYVYEYNGSELTDITTPEFSSDTGLKITARPDANGFRLMTYPEWIYSARIITDERQLLDFKTQYGQRVEGLFHKKGEETGYKYYFQNTDEGIFSIYNIAANGGYHYTGSGAALASASVASNGLITYDKAMPRTGAQAMGRDSSSSGLGSYLRIKGNYRDNIDYNCRNGAGLWRMSGLFFNVVNCPSYFCKGGSTGLHYYPIVSTPYNRDPTMSGYTQEFRMGNVTNFGEPLKRSFEASFRCCRTLK